MQLLLRPRTCLRGLYNSSSGPHAFTRCRALSTVPDSLRILFCGSDEFSIASLRALHAHHKQQPDSIASIDVVHRPGKPTGRGLKVIRQVPIKHAAEELELRTHAIDTFTGWSPPPSHTGPINLVVAVSFGLLVPPRILDGAEYGGLNVHPSLLPDLHGPAPIHHTLLKLRQRTGISVQTLHPRHFDRGTILAQSPRPGLEVPNQHACTPEQLRDFLAPIGANTLLDVIKTRQFIRPLKNTGWYPSDDSDPIDHAGKITKEHMRVDWAVSDIDDILLRHRVFGSLWCTIPFQISRGGQRTRVEKRVVIHKLEAYTPKRRLSDYGKPGFFVEDTEPDQWPNADLLALTGNFRDLENKGRNIALRILSCTTDGGKKGQGRMEVLNSLRATAHGGT